MKYLIIRFRQMGDAILATCLFNSIKANDPEAETTFVLNERIEPLFRHHPSIDHIITFSEAERHSLYGNLHKMWQTVHQNRYDVIIDMRSTVNTLGFTLFSMKSRHRIGLQKGYTRPFFTYAVPRCQDGVNMVEHNLSLLRPLGFERLVRTLSLRVLPEERAEYGRYLQECGLDLTRPLVVMGVSAKLPDKRWSLDGMAHICRQLLQRCPEAQLVFNYAPGEEAEQTLHLWNMMGKPEQVFINVAAKGLRALSVLTSFAHFYFGNEGGTRHAAHAHGVPSFVVMAPQHKPQTWIPKDEVPAGHTGVYDVLTEEERASLTQPEQYARITPQLVWQKLEAFLNQNHLLETKKR